MDVIGDNDGPPAQLWLQNIEYGQIKIFPSVEEHQVDRSSKVFKRLQGVSFANFRKSRQPCFIEIAACYLGLACFNFRSDKTSAIVPHCRSKINRRNAKRCPEFDCVPRIDSACRKVEQPPYAGRNTNKYFRDKRFGCCKLRHAFQPGEQETWYRSRKHKYVALSGIVKSSEDRIDTRIVKPRPSGSH
jgi:hypothetical protein